MILNENEEKAIALLKQIENFDDLCETCYYIDTERKNKFGCWGCREEAKDIVLSLVEKLQKENEEKTTILLAGAEKIKQLEEENKESKIDRDKFKKALAKRITYCNELEKDLFENCSNYVVSKQNIKAKIEEIDIEIQKCEYSDDDDEEYKKSVEKDKLCLLNQKRILQELLKK